MSLYPRSWLRLGTSRLGGVAPVPSGGVGGSLEYKSDIAILSPLGRGGTAAHGGITPVIRSLTGALCERGLRVELLTFAPSDPRALVPGLDRRAALHNLGQGRLWQQRRWLAARLATQRPRVLLAAGHRANLLAASLAGGETRVVLSVHNTVSTGLRGLGLLRRAWRLRGLRRMYPRADAIVCVSAGVAEDLRRYLTLPAGRITIIHNPIQTRVDEPAARLHPWLSDRGQTVILGAGRLSPQKDFMTLIHAFALLSDLPDHRLMIIGEGPERAHLEREIARLGIIERVTLPGFVTNPRACMAASALFVLSSAWEGFGNVLVEAMAMGTPVVSTDCPSGPREILQDGALGPLVPVGDAPALARAIRQSLIDPVPAERLRGRADDFAPARVVVPYLEVLLPEALA